MSSTNKTTNYELSQFLGTDKPAWLSDYNTDMSKIDTRMKANADAASAASGAATSNATAIGTLASLTTTAKTDLVSAINEVDSNADTAQGTATNAATTATSALDKANLALANSTAFNLTSFVTTSAANFTDKTLFTNMGGDLTVASNSDGSVFKLYGQITFNKNVGESSFKLTSAVRPDSQFTINPAGFYVESNTGYIRAISATIATNGVITCSVYGGDVTGGNAIFPPCLYFAKDFGDTPTPAE